MHNPWGSGEPKSCGKQKCEGNCRNVLEHTQSLIAFVAITATESKRPLTPPKIPFAVWCSRVLTDASTFPIANAKKGVASDGLGWGGVGLGDSKGAAELVGKPRLLRRCGGLGTPTNKDFQALPYPAGAGVGWTSAPAAGVTLPAARPGRRAFSRGIQCRAPGCLRV